MEDVLQYALSVVALIFFTVASVCLKGLSKYFEEKANTQFDDARSAKIQNVTALITSNIGHVITLYLKENDISVVNKSNINKVVKDISERIGNMTGSGIKDFILKTIADNWDEWLYEMILQELHNRYRLDLNDGDDDHPGGLPGPEVSN